MKVFLLLRKPLEQQRGATAIIVALVLTVLLGFAALAVDVGYLMVGRNELQNVADAAALAGARTLGRLYECNGDLVNCPGPMPYENQLTYYADAAAIQNAITDVASKNQAGGKTGITINDADIVIGNWDRSSKPPLTATLTSPDAVRVTARRDSSANSPISTFFARIFNKNFVDVSATATAALTGESTAGPGELPLPLAINKSWVAKLPCNNNLKLHPSSGEICSAWHAYDGETYKPNNSSKKGMPPMVDALAAQTYGSPETVSGQTQYDFTNGTSADIFTDRDNKDGIDESYIEHLFNVMKIKNDGILDMDTDPDTWTTGVPIFDDTEVGCSPSGKITIVGFTTITITAVNGPPDNTIYGEVKCDNVVTGRGSGENYGTKGSIPGLVQ